MEQKVRDFFSKQKSTSAALEDFIEQFWDVYDDADNEQKNVIEISIHQMFKKYYYSEMEVNYEWTPAKIINTLVEREFGKNIMIVPGLDIKYKSKRISDIVFTTTCFSEEHHPFVKDIEMFIEFAKNGITLEEPGIMEEKERGSFLEKILLKDKHYANIICLISLEAGLLEKNISGNIIRGMLTEKSESFLHLDNKEKLQLTIDAAVKTCSNMLIGIFPELTDAFSVKSIFALLKQPKKIENLLQSSLKKIGVNLEKKEFSYLNANLMDMDDVSEEEIKNAHKLLVMIMAFDIYFSTPFGYYLQLIQPIYHDCYDIDSECYILFSHMDNIQLVRNLLFAAPDGYDLTPLGEVVLIQGKDSKRKQVLPDSMTDEKIYTEIIDNNDLDDRLLNLFEENILYFNTNKDDEEFIKPKKPVSRKSSKSNEKFVFKVKIFYNKRAYKKIEIEGNKTLDDLNNLIMKKFDLECGHLYSFFMSNKAWDTSTEYSHPNSDGSPADKVRIDDLGLKLKSKFMYLHDYGDENKFEVELIDKTPYQQ